MKIYEICMTWKVVKGWHIKKFILVAGSREHALNRFQEQFPDFDISKYNVEFTEHDIAEIIPYGR